MSESEREAENENGALLERLTVIEQQPLESRAEAFQQLHDELQRELDGGHAE